MVRFTRARTHVHMWMYTIQRYWYDMIHDISKLRIFPIWRIWVLLPGTYYCDMYRGHGNTQGMRGVRKQLHTAGGTKHMAALSDGFE